MSDLPDVITERLRANKKAIFWAGAGFVLTGFLAACFPVVATLSITFFVALVLLVTGLISFFNAFSIAGTGPFFGSLLLGLLKLAAGVIIFVHPAIGMLYLTAMLAVIFMFEGAFEMSYAFEIRPLKGWSWVLFSSLLSVLAGMIIIFTLPSSSLWLVGLIFGINAMSTGLAAAFVAKNIDRDE